MRACVSLLLQNAQCVLNLHTRCSILSSSVAKVALVDPNEYLCWFRGHVVHTYKCSKHVLHYSLGSHHRNVKRCGPTRGKSTHTHAHTQTHTCRGTDFLLRNRSALCLRSGSRGPARHPKRGQVERGLGDDQSPRGMWGDLDPWLASLWSSLLQLKPLPSGTVIDDTPRLEPALFAMTPVAVTASGGNTSIAAGVGGGPHDQTSTPVFLSSNI